VGLLQKQQAMNSGDCMGSKSLLVAEKYHVATVGGNDKECLIIVP
jgi:hypothetical protein